ncbi:hypothetical protein CONCODRAFT_12814 [Conidiobolus coronatus NRRL 28638]|uniref:Uncharacterized protein n=1 Tax=Conidiobolus coronatus (strain ATCC 28846 / CBS 209.66 / NRRL 28638) TaxID=796925 RepID=A0A137NS41_CONC2|nr:hypothetical protein CONCODRAFT_12814 [Conidiobolus coronatus NRRL 28638]|eukprot:KXN65557.1 hypothetical protein CONCODRAFT_12814 [Conidiobolus coronatus NRRL 28638]
MKEQTPLLYPLADEPENQRRFSTEKILVLATEAKRRFSIKKVLTYALLTFIIYQIIGMITKRLWWRLNTTCTWKYNDQDYAMQFAKCIPQSLECRKYCNKGDKECNQKCYDLDSSCYEPYYGWNIPQIEKCDTSYKLVFEL